MWVILVPPLNHDVQPSQMAPRGWQRVFSGDVCGNNTPRRVSFPYAHDTWQLGSLFSIFAPGFYPSSPPEPPIFEHTRSAIHLSCCT